MEIDVVIGQPQLVARTGRGVAGLGGPVGVETLAAALAESRDTIEEVIEPFLIQEGLALRTPRGRVATPAFSTVAAVATVLGLSLDAVWHEVGSPVDASLAG